MVLVEEVEPIDSYVFQLQINVSRLSSLLVDVELVFDAVPIKKSRRFDIHVLIKQR